MAAKPWAVNGYERGAMRRPALAGWKKIVGRKAPRRNTLAAGYFYCRVEINDASAATLPPPMRPSSRQITASDVKLGEPLPFSVYDTAGRLLLRKGMVLTMPSQVEHVIERRAVMGMGDGAGPAPAPATPARRREVREVTPVFEQMGGLILNLKHGLSTALRMPDQIDLDARVRQFGAKLQALCQEDVDSALAAPHLDHVNPYLIVHQVMGAVLTEVIGRRCGLAASERLALVCAALTRDIGLFALSDQLDQCRGPLPDALKQAMQAHPRDGVQLLRRAGVADPLWLDAVAQHHERLDGAGYPAALAGAAVGQGGRILAIADVYSAMTKPRPYRDQEHLAQSALREIYLQKESGLDGALIQMMIKEIGMFPPGSIVKLQNGEIAVIKHCTSALAEAVVYTVYDQRGMPLLEPLRRDSALPGNGIVSMVSFSKCRSAAVTIKRVWLK
jgi:HD-GYP domain-containing protein (c-di-GMP phosphodiesterase class II)